MTLKCFMTGWPCGTFCHPNLPSSFLSSVFLHFHSVGDDNCLTSDFLTSYSIGVENLHSAPHLLWSRCYFLNIKKKKFHVVIVFPSVPQSFCCIDKNLPLPLCWCSYKWVMPWTTWRSYSVSAEATARSSLWKEHFAWRVYRPCLGMTLRK